MRLIAVVTFTAIFGLFGSLVGYCLEVFGASRTAGPLSAGAVAAIGFFVARTLQPRTLWRAVLSMILTSGAVWVGWRGCLALLSKWSGDGNDRSGLTTVPLLIMIPFFGIGNGCLTVVLLKGKQGAQQSGAATGN